MIGPAGTGKSLLVLHYIAAAVARGERAALFVFDEELGLLFERAQRRSASISQAMRDAEQLFIEQMDAAELSPGEFSHRVRSCVDREASASWRSTASTATRLPCRRSSSSLLHLHELLQYLNRQGATTFLTVAQHGMIGDMKQTVDVTYLADTVIMLRYFEALGRVRRAISVIKKRTGSHEDTIREFQIDASGASRSGPPLEIPGRAARRANLRRKTRTPYGRCPMSRNCRPDPNAP